MIDYADKFKKLVIGEGYELLNEYVNSKVKVKIKCPEGHIWETTPNIFQQGHRCPKCAGLCPIQAKEKFIQTLDQEGYKLIGVYKSALKKVKLKCKKGHEYNVTPNSFKNGSRCPKCSNHCPIQAKEQFIKILSRFGYILLSEYNGTKINVKLKCNKGHIYTVKPNNFKSGCRCPICAGLCPEQAKDQFLELLAKEGYELIEEYKSSMTKVKIRCNKDHEYKVTPNDFKNNDSRCPVCAGLCPEQAKDQFLELLTEERYELLSEYKNNYTKVELKCPNGHEWNVIPSSFKNYRRCPHCEGSTGQRLLQKILKDYIQDKVIYNDRKILNGLELDIYYPDLNIGIEYQGNYWHSLPEAIKRDKRKRKLCEEKGINLIEVWDNDFLKDQDSIIKDLIKNIRG